VTEDRAAVLATVAARIDALPTGRTVRVAVDGVTASGKSTFADDRTTTSTAHAVSGTRSS
jgi:hypothetical protein